jgi:rhamnogalacturonan endolyase
VSDLDPSRPGLEVFAIHERARHANGINLRDARTGEVLWGKSSPDVGRGLAMDIDPRWPGAECWASGRGLEGLYNCKGEQVSGTKPRSCNMGAWWDGDLLRELVDGTLISKWDHEAERTVPLLSVREAGCVSNNGTKANPCLVADIVGDWREEVVWRAQDGKELRVYSTGIETPHRLPTLMHDRTYRLGVAWQNVGYNQPAHVGFSLGEQDEK